MPLESYKTSAFVQRTTPPNTTWNTNSHMTHTLTYQHSLHQLKLAWLYFCIGTAATPWQVCLFPHLSPSLYHSSLILKRNSLIGLCSCGVSVLRMIETTQHRRSNQCCRSTVFVKHWHTKLLAEDYNTHPSSIPKLWHHYLKLKWHTAFSFLTGLHKWWNLNKHDV